jgi:predicted DNA-binding WGR domain protein
MNLTYLERVDPARNMLRFYAIRISPTLFGEWAVVREWGRIGSPGRERQSWFASESEAVEAGVKARREKERRGYRSGSKAPQVFFTA